MMAVWQHAMRGVRFLGGLIILLVFIPPTLVTWLLPRRARVATIAALGRAWARCMLAVIRVHIDANLGQADLSSPALCVANHTGYLDILVLLAVSPGCFISRPIAWWPVLGQLAYLAGTLFVDRRNRFSTKTLVPRMRSRLRAGYKVCFFPEGTTSDGKTLLPFKPPLFAAAAGEAGEAFPVRPFVIRYTRLAGRPIDDSNRHELFWYGEMTLLGHVWNLIGQGVRVRVEVLPDRYIAGSRREFAEALRAEMLAVYQPSGEELGAAPNAPLDEARSQQ